MISLHRPGLRFGQGNRRETNFLCPDSRQISLSTARTSSSIVSLAELVDVKSILGSPFIDQAVQMAGLVFVAEMQLCTSLGTLMPSMDIADGLEELSHQSNYQNCLRTLQMMMVYWRGLVWIVTAMEQKRRGIQNTDPGEDSIDPYDSASLSDRKMIMKLLKRVEQTRSEVQASHEQQDASKSTHSFLCNLNQYDFILTSHSHWYCCYWNDELRLEEKGHSDRGWTTTSGTISARSTFYRSRPHYQC